MIRRILLLLGLLSILSCANDSRAVMLWKIEHNNLAKPSYIFGTYHSRDKKVNDILGEITQVLESTQTLYTETTMTKKSHKMIQNFMQDSHLPSLQKRLSPSTFKRLQQHIKNTNIPLSIHNLSIFKTWAIALLLINYAESKNNPHVLFMDERLVKSAKDSAMPCLGLETPKEQLVYFDILSPEEQELLLVDSINQTEDERYTQALKRWYIKGDIKGFNALQHIFKDTDPKIQALDEKLFASLLTERNSRFLQRIHRILQKNPQENYFFAVGSGHLAEEYGLIELLRKKGYQLKKVN